MMTKSTSGSLSNISLALSMKYSAPFWCTSLPTKPTFRPGGSPRLSSVAAVAGDSPAMAAAFTPLCMTLIRSRSAPFSASMMFAM